MSLGTSKQPSIQMTLFEYFMDTEQFTIKEAEEIVKQVKEVKTPSVRARVYEGIDAGIFERIDKGVYSVKREHNGVENNCLLINGDGRNISMIEDNSIDALVTDHPYKLDKSLKGGNRNFAEYESFLYTQKDFDEKARVLKPGCFLVEFLPEENADNYKYIYQVKEMAANSGLEYYSTVPWKKGDFVANTGRKAKNTEQVVMFCKGKARELKLDAKKNKAMISEMMIYHFEEDYNSLIPSENEEEDVIEFEFLIKTDDYDNVSREMDKAYMDWMGGCKDSILYEADTTSDDLSQIPIGDYICMWLDKHQITYFDVTGKYGDLDYGQLSDSKFLEKTLEILKEGYPGALNYMSGTNGMLPTVFDIDQVPKNSKIHQAEKPVELLEQIITFISKPNEKILDQFCGSGVLGEAALNTGRDSIIIEKNVDAFKNSCERVNRARHR